jgi:hypothetical protein
MFAALYGKPGNGLPALCPLSVVIWDEFRYWDAVLTSPVVPFGGVTRSFARDTTLPFQLLTFDHHIFTDASTSSGWGAFLRDQVVFGPWPDLSRVDHICWLELTAIRIALFRFRYSLAGSWVLVHTIVQWLWGYSIAAIPGSSSWPLLCFLSWSVLRLGVFSCLELPTRLTPPAGGFLS